MAALRRRPRRQAGSASCAEVARNLQPFLDGECDELTRRRVVLHLEACRHCGLEAETYRRLKDSLRRGGAPVDAEALDRLREFAHRLSSGEELETGRERSS